MLHMQREKKRINVVVKPVSDGCNLACLYCYVAANPKKIKQMSLETLEKIHDASVKYNKNVEFVWHGGEPLLAGHDFYGCAMDIQKRMIHDKHAKKIRNVLQSNFTLIDNEFVDIFRDGDFVVGTSIDGIKEIHDQTRPYIGGRGSFDDVMRGIELVRSAGLESGVIACYTKFMVGREKEVYQFMRDNCFHWQLAPYISSGRGEQNIDDIGISPKQYADAINFLFDIYVTDNPPNRMETVDVLLNNLFRASKRERPEARHIKRNCQSNYIGIDWNGDVYPCSRFTSFPEFKLGNINEQPLEEILEHPIRVKLKNRDWDTVEGCSDCKYKRACDTGCPYDAFVFNGDYMSRDYYCEAYKAIWEHMLTNLVEMKKRGVLNGEKITG